jgi:hypothetical protein
MTASNQTEEESIMLETFCGFMAVNFFTFLE